ncbi:MAG: hypothetical protein MPN21_10595 [Thermoanaerobaculia bacterium]|nr:hypothetical protein [Thermoanaerobaculia bacterium]
MRKDNMNEPARSDSPDARAWWTLAVVVAVVLIAYLGLSAGRMSSSRDSERPAVDQPVAGVTENEESTPTPRPGDTTALSEPSTDPGSQPLDPQLLREFGELGVLPGLLGDFSDIPDCDFDDALSTCQ